MNNFRKILFLLKPKEKKSALMLLIMVIFMGFMEVAGVLSIMPFIVVLSNPEVIETNNLLKNTYEFSKTFGVKSNNRLLIKIFEFFCKKTLAFKNIIIHISSISRVL